MVEDANAPAVSVITPAFNAETTLPDTIRSCVAQTFPDFELLVVDDGSTDRTVEIVTAYAARDPRIRLLRRPNGGTAAARNTGLRHARGRFIALLDSDDIWMPDYLSRQLSLLASRPEVAVATANAINMGGRLDGRPLWPAANGTRDITLLDLITRENSVCIMSVFRREVTAANGGFDERFVTNEDYAFWLRAGCAGFRIAADLTPRAYYRRRPDSKSSNNRATLTGISIVLRQIRTLLPEGSDEVRALDRQLARFKRELMLLDARVALERRDPVEALCCLGQIPADSRSARESLLIGIGRVWPPALTLGYDVRRAVRRTAATIRKPFEAGPGTPRRAARTAGTGAARAGSGRPASGRCAETTADTGTEQAAG